jgi:Caspase domain
VNRWKPLTLGIGAIAVTTAALVPLFVQTRGVRLVVPAEIAESAPEFDPKQSVGLFVGVRTFSTGATEVPYAVDDAVDLAFMFTLHKHVRTVDPTRVILAIDGEPEKPDSKARLRELEKANVQVRKDVTANAILSLVREQAARVRGGGVYVFSLATHGFQHRGVPYILGSASRMRDTDSSVSATEIADIIDSSPAGRSVLFLDACRDRLPTRGGPSKAVKSFFRRLKRSRGQVVFAAANGMVTYDDKEHRNGVFTRSVIRGLKCEAAKTRGVVTAADLHAFIEREVMAWHKAKHGAPISRATNVSMNGMTRLMPLARCNDTPMPPQRIMTAGIEATKTHLAHLDGDSEFEVVAVTAKGIVAFDHDQKHLWSYESHGRPRSLAIGTHRNRKTYIAALFSTRLVTLDEDGNELSTLESSTIRFLAMYRPTPDHSSKVVVASHRAVLVLEPKHVDKPESILLGASVNDTIETIEILDRDNDRRPEIALTLRTGGGYFLELKEQKAERAPNTKAGIHLLPDKSLLRPATILGR